MAIEKEEAIDNPLGGLYCCQCGDAVAYYFKQNMTTPPTGDVYCYDCIRNFTDVVYMVQADAYLPNDLHVSKVRNAVRPARDSVATQWRATVRLNKDQRRADIFAQMDKERDDE